ncbi:hypothetical protein FOCC_FOCC016072 [Frankliniella occidentalis]|nr:hypothetical protein FOCC_FOCC016072 [Frankliniella occidentalis]
MSKLPEDGNVFDQVTLVINVDSEEAVEDEPTEIDDEEVVNTIIETCIPSISPPTSTDKAECILKWPTIGKDAINEFKTPGYIAMAFPTLFPFGKADLRNPREHNITPKQYFKHLMNYQDGRFAKHPRFKYFARNSEMRWNALKFGGVFVKKNSEFQDMDMDQLQEKLQQNPALLKKILFYNSSLRGTRLYWYARGQELLTMIEQLGLPTLFFTLSAADLHWPELFLNIAPDEDLSTMTESRRRKLIEENPLRVDALFLRRGENFINQRFTSYSRCFMVKNAPKFEDLTKETPQRRQEIADYFDKFISTTHPDIHCPKGPIYPCRKRLSEVVDLEKDLAELLNRVQRHTEHRDGYCMRTNKKTKKKECRFKFPKELADKTEIRYTEDNDLELITARNDPCLNKNNRYFIQTWRANIDVSPVLSKRA